MDSTTSTISHINTVRAKIENIIMILRKRAEKHDRSKLENPKEKEGFDRFSEIKNSRSVKYGTKEYFDMLKEMKPVLELHYSTNRHHPEYHKRGIDDMNMIDILEMYADWASACESYGSCDFEKSLKINKKRFKMSRQLYNIFLNTHRYLNE